MQTQQVMHYRFPLVYIRVVYLSQQIIQQAHQKSKEKIILRIVFIRMITEPPLS